jgi:hypothetical protein
MSGEEYARHEDDAVREFYRAYAQTYAELPEDIEGLVGRLAERTGLARDAGDYPTDPGALLAAAAALGAEGLDLGDPDPGLLDRFIHERLLDPRLRPMFLDGSFESNEGQRELARLAESILVPDEPLLYYALGAFWGEWLCRHAGAKWFVHAPLRPLQSFPDACEQGTALLALPFSHVTKKLASPDGDMLEAKAQHLAEMLTFPPLALAASLVDGPQVIAELLPGALKSAEELLADGQVEVAFSLLADAVNENVDNGHFLHKVEQLGWKHEQFALVHHCSGLQVQLAPHNPRILHNFAVIESMRNDGLENAIGILFRVLEIDGRYGRGRLTLASCLHEAGRDEEARDHAQYVVDHHPELKEEAAELLREIHGAA